jgi:hypothetical protein
MKIKKNAPTEREIVEAAVEHGLVSDKVAGADRDFVLDDIMEALDAVIEWDEEPGPGIAEMSLWWDKWRITPFMPMDNTTNGPCPTTPSYGRPGQGL